MTADLHTESVWAPSAAPMPVTETLPAVPLEPAAEELFAAHVAVIREGGQDALDVRRGLWRGPAARVALASSGLAAGLYEAEAGSPTIPVTVGLFTALVGGLRLIV